MESVSINEVYTMEERVKVYPMLNRRNSKKGFTLVELIVVLVILAILAAVAVPALLGYTDEAKEKKYIAEAKGALTATESMMSNVYNDGLAVIPSKLRATARVTAGHDTEDGSSFIIWTDKKFDDYADGTYKSIAAYSISRALYGTADGKYYLYYDGSSEDEWIIYDAVKEATVISDIKKVTSGTASANIIYVWPYNSTYADDSASAFTTVTTTTTDEEGNTHTTTELKEKDKWVDNDELLEDDPEEVVNPITVTFTSVAVGDTKGIVYNTSNGSGTDVSVQYTPDGSTEFNAPTYAVKQALFDDSTISWSWEYTGSGSSTPFSSYEDISSILENNNAANVTVTATISQRTVDFDVEFDPFNSATQKVYVGDEADNTNTVEYSYGLVDGKITNVSSETPSDVVVEPQTGLDNVKFDDRWVAKIGTGYIDGSSYASVAKGDLTDSNLVDDSASTGTVSVLDNWIRSYASSCVSDYIAQVGDTTDKNVATTNLTALAGKLDISFEAPATVNKTVFVKAREKNEASLLQFGKESANSFEAHFGTYELTGSIKQGTQSLRIDNVKHEIMALDVTSGNESVYSLIDSKDSSFISIGNSKKFKFWYISHCDIDNDIPVIPATGAEELKTRDHDVTYEVVSRLFSTSNNHEGEVAEIDVTDITAKYVSSDKDQPSTGNYCALHLKFEELIDGRSNSSKLRSINYISEEDIKSSSSHYSEKDKEICLSVTEIASSGDFLQREDSDDGFGDYVISKLNGDYPGYIVGYSVHDEVNDIYDIYVFTEENTRGKITGSACKLFDAFTKMETCTLVPNLETSGVTTMYGLFNGDASLSLENVSLDVSGSQNFMRMFKSCENVKNVTLTGTSSKPLVNVGLKEMFNGCKQLQSISMPDFDTSNVNTLEQTFYNCNALTTIVGLEGFETGNVTTMASMFRYCNSLTSLNLNNFDTSQVTNMSYMFDNCRSLASIDVSSFDTCKVTTMQSMFGNQMIDGQAQYNDSLTELDISSFDTRALTTIKDMFIRCRALKTIYVNPLQWKYDKFVYSGKDENGGNVFKGCYALEGGNGTKVAVEVTQDYIPGSAKDKVVEGTNIALNSLYAVADEASNDDLNGDGKFGEKGYFTAKDKTKYARLDILNDNWAVAFGLVNSKEDIAGFKRSSVSKEDAITLSGGVSRSVAPDLGEFTVNGKYDSHGLRRDQYLDDVGNPIPVYFWAEKSGNKYIINWWSEAEKVFMNKESLAICYGWKNATSVDFSGIDFSDMQYFSCMFYDCQNLTTLSNFSLSGAVAKDKASSSYTGLKQMFYNCKKLTSISLSGLNTTNVTSMYSTFESCEKLESLDLSVLDTSNVKSFYHMLYKCVKLTNLTLGGSFKTTSATSMEGMFSTCSILTSIDVSGFDTSNVTTMKFMFLDCKALTSVDISSFDFSNVKSTEKMFNSCLKLTTIYASENINLDKVVPSSGNNDKGKDNDYNMFNECNELVGGAGTTYQEAPLPLGKTKAYAHIDGGESNPGYFTKKPSNTSNPSNTNEP